MQLSNTLDKFTPSTSPALRQLTLRSLTLALFPLAPHISSEMWMILCGGRCAAIPWTEWRHAASREVVRCASAYAGVVEGDADVSRQPWPRIAAWMLEPLQRQDCLAVHVHIGGRRRGCVDVPMPLEKEGDHAALQAAVEQAVYGDARLSEWLRDKHVSKVVFVRDRGMINFVVKK